MVELMAPKLIMPNSEFGLDIFCPNWERNRHWEARQRLLRTARRWARQ
jgi:hypothetical protein